MDRTLEIRLEDEPVAQKAAEWLLELRSESISGERIAEWQQWLTEDARHREAFESVESAWSLMDQATTARWPTEAEVAEDAYAGEISVAAWRWKQLRSHAASVQSKRGMMRNRLVQRFVPLASGCLIAATIVWGLFAWPALNVALQGGTRINIRTQVGEMRTLALPDGSILSAGGNTALTATLLKHTRTVTLDRGEAFFKVAKDPGRPFTVRAGTTSVTAIGTAFDVRRLDGQVVVAVAEGVVRVAEPAPKEGEQVVAASRVAGEPSFPHASEQLRAGQRLAVNRSNGASEISSVDSRLVAGWRQGRLQYLNEPLGIVVADLARYSQRRIDIKDPEVATLRVTGVVFEQNLDAWFASLESTFPVEILTHEDGSVSIAALRNAGNTVVPAGPSRQ